MSLYDSSQDIPARNVDPDRHLVRTLARDLDRALVRARALAAALDGTLVRGLVLDRALDLDRALGRDLDSVCRLTRALGVPGVLVFTFSGSGPAPAPGLDLDSARVRGLDLESDLDLDLALDSVRDLVAVLEGTREQVHRVVVGLESGVADEVAVVQVQIAMCAGWLVRVALRVVPEGERVRYGEEWRGELWDLAAGSGRRVRQTVHAVRLVVRAWPVRAGIREGRRRAAGGG